MRGQLFTFECIIQIEKSMKTYISIFAALILVSFSSACNNEQKSKEQGSVDTVRVAPEPVEKTITADKLAGKWVEPIPGQEPAMQGIQLNADGTASSINMHTLLYEKWELKGDSLFLWNHTEGVKSTGSYVDTTIVKTLTDSSLVLAGRDGIKVSYKREK
jgi:hypothetical protein